MGATAGNMRMSFLISAISQAVGTELAQKFKITLWSLIDSNPDVEV